MGQLGDNKVRTMHRLIGVVVGFVVVAGLAIATGPTADAAPLVSQRIAASVRARFVLGTTHGLRHSVELSPHSIGSGVAMTSSGHKAFVAQDDSRILELFGRTPSPTGLVYVVDTATGNLDGYWNPDMFASDMVLAPDESHLYLSSSIENLVGSVETATGSTRWKKDLSDVSVYAIALTPDEKWVLVTTYRRLGAGGQNELRLISADDPATEHILVHGGDGRPIDVGVTPDGRYAVVITEFGGIATVDIASRKVIKVTSDPSVLNDVAMTVDPDNSTFHVARGARIFTFDVVSHNKVRDFGATAGAVADIVVAPDGDHVLSLRYLKHPSRMLVYGEEMADTPGQLLIEYPEYFAHRLAASAQPAPVADFAVEVQPYPAPVRFDGSASQGRNGAPIVRWDWEFSDGSTASTTNPEVEHTYTTPGTYEAKLTVTDSTGTSTTKVFNGETMLRNGGPSATTVRRFTTTATTATNLVIDPSSIKVGETAKMIATVTMPSGVGFDQGDRVSFWGPTGEIGSVKAGPKVELQHQFTKYGDHEIYASFEPAPVSSVPRPILASRSPEVMLKVEPYESNISLKVSPSPAKAGDELTITTDVQPVIDPQPSGELSTCRASGKVSISYDGVLIKTTPGLPDTIKMTAPSDGLYNVTAEYLGNNFCAPASAGLVHRVGDEPPPPEQTDTYTDLKLLGDLPEPGSDAQFSALVTDGSKNLANCTGPFQYFVDGEKIQDNPLVVGDNFLNTKLSAGTHTVEAAYVGDDICKASSDELTVEVVGGQVVDVEDPKPDPEPPPDTEVLGSGGDPGSGGGGNDGPSLPMTGAGILRMLALAFVLIGAGVACEHTRRERGGAARS